jgi:hypothetical protein
MKGEIEWLGEGSLYTSKNALSEDAQGKKVEFPVHIINSGMLYPV